MRKNTKCSALWFGAPRCRKQAEILPCECWRDFIGCPSIGKYNDMGEYLGTGTYIGQLKKVGAHAEAGVRGIRDTMIAQMKS